jgi:hypothetical protein
VLVGMNVVVMSEFSSKILLLSIFHIPTLVETTTTEQTSTTTQNCGPNDISVRAVFVILLLVLAFVYFSGFAAY